MNFQENKETGQLTQDTVQLLTHFLSKGSVNTQPTLTGCQHPQ